MKGYDLFIAVGQVEDRFIEESEQEQSLKAETKRVYSTWIKCGAAAACLLVCLIGLSVWKKNGNVSEREVVNCYTGENTEYYEKNTQEDSAKFMEKLEGTLAFLPLITESDFIFSDWANPTEKMRISSPYDTARNHFEVDFAGTKGDSVYAVFDGEITEVGFSEIEGNYIVLVLEGETRVIYGHLEKMMVSVGQMVNKGEQIATLGQTGQATGPCLSLKVMVEGEAVNPLK